MAKKPKKSKINAELEDLLTNMGAQVQRINWLRRGIAKVATDLGNNVDRSECIRYLNFILHTTGPEGAKRAEERRELSGE